MHFRLPNHGKFAPLNYALGDHRLGTVKCEPPHHVNTHSVLWHEIGNIKSSLGNMHAFDSPYNWCLCLNYNYMAVISTLF